MRASISAICLRARSSAPPRRSSEWDSAALSCLSVTCHLVWRSCRSRTSAASVVVPEPNLAAICARGFGFEGPLRAAEAFVAQRYTLACILLSHAPRRAHMVSEIPTFARDLAAIVGAPRRHLLGATFDQDRRRATDRGQAFCWPLALELKKGEIAEARGNIRMAGGENLLAHLQCALVERLGFGIAALRLIDEGQIVLGCGNRRVGGGGGIFLKNAAGARRGGLC